jgi:hypothetical protein
MLINVVYSSCHPTNQVSVLLIMTSCENNPLNSKCTTEWVKTIFMFSTPQLMVVQVVEALHYKPEGHRFDSRWCHFHF